MNGLKMSNKITLKTCSKCKEEKESSNFCKNKSRRDGLHHACKSCVKKINADNKNYFAEYSKKWELENKDKRREQKRLIQKKWIKNHPNYNNEYIAKRKIVDDVYRLGFRVRGLIRKAIIRRGYSKSKKTESILGCSIAQFAVHIESQFKDGMSWDKIESIHLDHIIPVSSAKTEIDVITLNHYLNLRPLWAKENILKGAKLPAPIQKNKIELSIAKEKGLKLTQQSIF